MRSFTTRPIAVLAVLVGALLAASAAQAEPEKVAVFDFQLAGGAPSPPTDDDKARLARTSEQLRQLMKDSGRFEIVSTETVRAEAASKDLRACGGCADDLGRKLGADAIAIGEVQKVSNLILNMNVYLKPLREGAKEQAYSVDLRGNTEESFDRGIKYLVKNQLLERPR